MTVRGPSLAADVGDEVLLRDIRCNIASSYLEAGRCREAYAYFSTLAAAMIVAIRLAPYFVVPLLVACFRALPGLSAGMYALFSAAEFLGRSVGGAAYAR